MGARSLMIFKPPSAPLVTACPVRWTKDGSVPFQRTLIARRPLLPGNCLVIPPSPHVSSARPPPLYHRAASRSHTPALLKKPSFPPLTLGDKASRIIKLISPLCWLLFQPSFSPIYHSSPLPNSRFRFTSYLSSFPLSLVFPSPFFGDARSYLAAFSIVASRLSPQFSPHRVIVFPFWLSPSCTGT